MLKIQCQCGHKMAVPDGYAGKRVKCAKCKGAVTVPGGVARAPVTAAAPAAAPATAAVPVAMSKTGGAGRVHRSRRHALERKQKSHNVTVAIIAGVMVVLGTGLLLFIGSMNRPVDPPAPQVAVNASTGDGPQSPSGLPTIQKRKGAVADVSGAMAIGGADDLSQPAAEDDSVTIAGQRFTAGSAAPAIAGTTSTFDSENNVTTITAASLPFTVDGKTMQMTMMVTHDGNDVRKATQIGALIRITGNFTGLIAGANTDDPRLTIEADGRDEFFLPPVNRGESDDRRGVNGAEILPKWVEFSMGMAELKAIAHAKSLRTTLGGAIFELTKEQKALFQSLVPGGVTASSSDDTALPSVEKPESTEPAAPADDVDLRADKEEMDEKEMMKKK